MSRPEPDEAAATGYGRPAIGGLVAALAGLAVWVALAYFTHRDVGYLGWAVGALAGLGVYVAGRKPPDEQDELRAIRAKRRGGAEPADPDHRGVKLGLLATGIAAAVVIAGSVATAALRAAGQNQATAPTVSEDALIREYADASLRERQAKGEKLKYPPNMKLSQPFYPEEYPAGVWAEAEGKWKQLPPAEQKAKLAEKTRQTNELVQSQRSGVRSAGLADELGPLDVLWLLLGAGTAYFLGWRAAKFAPPPEE